MSRYIHSFQKFISTQLVESEEGGDYISGNDWTMDHDWANYKDHYNDSGSMDFDVEDSELEPEPTDADRRDSSGSSVTLSDLKQMISDLGARIDSLESK